MMKNGLFFFEDCEAQLLPGRVPTEIGAKIIGCRTEDMQELARRKIVVPLGRPPKTSPKYYSTTLLLEIARDPVRMARISDAIVAFWARKNRNRRTNQKTEPVATPRRNGNGRAVSRSTPAAL